MEPQGQKQEKKHRCPELPDFLGPVNHARVLLPSAPRIPTGGGSLGGLDSQCHLGVVVMRRGPPQVLLGCWGGLETISGGVQL